MPRIRYHLTEHAAYDTIPLRVGVVPSSRKIFLEDIIDDADGTADQSHSQREKGRRHVLADLWSNYDGGINYGRWRVVTGPVAQEGQDLPVFTVLPLDSKEAKTAANLTDFLANERKLGDKSWLTPDYVATTLYRLVKSGQLSNQAHLAAHIREYVESGWNQELAQLANQRDALQDKLGRATSGLTDYARQLVEVAAEAEQAKTEVNELQELVAALKAQAINSHMSTPQNPTDSEQAELMAPAKSITRQWQSLTKNSEYMNVGVDAYVQDVTCQGNMIHLTFINSKGLPTEIHDFGVKNGFVSRVFDYLSNRKGRRAIFLITWKPGEPSMLASDTMMLEKYSHLWK